MVMIPNTQVKFQVECIFKRDSVMFKMNRIYWCDGGLKLEDISTKNVGEHDLTPRMKYIMVRLDN